MSSGRAPFAALDDIIVQARCLLLDFDGLICSLFAGTPAEAVADRLRKVLTKEAVRLPQVIENTADGFEILAFAASVTPDLTARVEAELTEAELAAVATAEPSTYILDVVAACRESARSAAVVSNNSAACVHAYLERHDLSREITVIAARIGHDPTVLKPSRHLIDQAANALGAIPSRCAMIGDSVTDIQAARAAGARSIGYATSPAHAKHLTAAGADAILFSMADLALRLRARTSNPVSSTHVQSGAVTTFCTASRAHLRRAGPDGLGCEQRGRARAVEGRSRPGGPTVSGRGSPEGLAVAGRQLRRVLRTRVLRRGGCRARHPGDRPLAVPAVSRCRARQHHGQAVTLAPSAP